MNLRALLSKAPRDPLFILPLFEVFVNFIFLSP